MIIQETFKLSNGVEIPKLGLGTWFISDDDVADAVKEAVKIGYRHIDTAQAYQNALHLFPPREDQWIPQTGTCSAIQHEGIEQVWTIIQEFKSQQQNNNWFYQRRQNQAKTWLMDLVGFSLNDHFYKHPKVKSALDRITDEVISGEKTPYSGAQELMRFYLEQS